MVTDTREPVRAYPIPAAGNTIAEDFARLALALIAIGVDVGALFGEVAGKADAVHQHQLGDVIGLVGSLAAKADADHVHALGGLSDVDTAGATVYQVLARALDGKWRPWTIDLANVIGAAAYAKLDGAIFTGPTRVPTPSIAADSLDAVNVTALRAAIAALVASSPAALDTLNELAAALGNDPAFATTVTNALAQRLRIDAPQVLTDPQKAALQAALGVPSTALVSTKASLRNRLLNPAFQICQDRALGATIQVSNGAGYAFDGVIVRAVGAGLLTYSQVAKVTPGGSPTRLRGVVTTGAAVGAANYSEIVCHIEGSDVADLQLGTPQARPVCWRMVVNFPAGTYAVALSNHDGSRCYVTPIVITPAEAGADKLISGIVPGCTDGSWIKDASGVGLSVRIVQACGASAQTATANAWVTSGSIATPAISNSLTAGAVYEIADIGLYAGGDLPAWEMPSYADDLRKCRRYYEIIYPGDVAINAYTLWDHSWPLSWEPKRVPPSSSSLTGGAPVFSYVSGIYIRVETASTGALVMQAAGTDHVWVSRYVDFSGAYFALNARL